MGLARNTFIAAALAALALASQTVHSSAATAMSTPAGSWTVVAQRMASPWPDLQADDGTFPAYNYAKASGVLPYGESMLGYGLLQAGLAAGETRQVHAGLRAIGFAARALLRRGAPSVFENLALAASYNLARTHLADDDEFAAIRPTLERALREIKPVWKGSGRRYFNKFLVEAVAWLELARTGLHSSVPGSVLSDPEASRRAAQELIDDKIGRLRFGLRAGGRGQTRALVLSDLPWNPAAYQGLSLGMLARAIVLLGPDASAGARSVLRQVANASWELTGPDGDLAYYGRSQEEAWALGLTAYGAQMAAHGATAEQAARFHALAERAMQHLDNAYSMGPKGLWITPALSQSLEAARHGLDRYADSVAYTGLSLAVTQWAASAQAGSGHPSASGSIAADNRSAYVVGQQESRMAVVRTRNLWFAVKQQRSDKIDLRYDFGLVAMKALGADGSWADAIPARPKVQGHPDSAGPVLLGGRFPAYATGRRVSVARDGSVTVSGAFATAGGRRVRAARFRFVPSGDCVTLSFELRRGEHAEYSAFVRRRIGSVSSEGVSGGGTRVTVTGASGFHVDSAAYSSGTDAVIRRVRFAFSGGEVRVATCSDR